MLTVIVMLVLMLMRVRFNRLRSLNKAEMPMRTGVGMIVDTTSVAMQCRRARTAHASVR